jgi:heme/copper-type cytochrome/quinol oxidase subunit 2
LVVESVVESVVVMMVVVVVGVVVVVVVLTVMFLFPCRQHRFHDLFRWWRGIVVHDTGRPSVCVVLLVLHARTTVACHQQQQVPPSLFSESECC